VRFAVFALDEKTSPRVPMSHPLAQAPGLPRPPRGYRPAAPAGNPALTLAP
jgi:hypothetical protein